LRCTLGVAIPLAIAASLGNPALGVPAAIGAFITGFTSLQGVYRTRIAAVLVAAFGMGITSFVGATAASSTVAIVATTAFAGYLCGTFGQLGPLATTVSLNSLIAFILFSSRPLAPGAALEQSGLVLAGGLVQALLVVLASPIARLYVERTALAEVYRKLEAYARDIASGAPAIPPMTPLATARQVLADPQPFARAAETARFERLLEDAEVIRKRLAAISETLTANPAAPVVRAYAAAVANRLRAVVAALRGGKSDLETWDEIDLAIEELQNSAVRSVYRAGAQDLEEHLHDAVEAAAMLSSGRVPTIRFLSRPQPGPYVRNKIDWTSRAAFRFAVVMGIAVLIGRQFAAERGYWIAMTAAIVLRSDFQTTFFRGFARIVGTLVGAVVATLVLDAVRGHPALQIAGVLIAAAAAYLTFNPNYALFTVAITSFVVLVLGMRGFPATTAIDARVLDTLAGGALAMLGFLLFPTWERERTRSLVADLLDAQRRLASAILLGYADPSKESRKAIASARTAVWRVRTAAEASIERLRHEPHRPHSIGVGRAVRILAASQRFGLASLALETALETRRPTRGTAALAEFAATLDACMAELAEGIRESHRVPREGRLRAALERLEDELETPDAAEGKFILERARAYVEAVTRIARLVG
jgi:uncharacterized membrane protein YccC